jgi:hypothetical protein
VALLLAALLIAAAIAWGSRLIAAQLARTRETDLRVRTLQVLAVFTPAVRDALADPRAILAWEPLARTARQLFPDEFALLDRAAGVSFPLGADRLQAAHAQWTTDWLTWERTHDAEYKLKAAVIEEELARSAGSTALRAKLETVEREKLDLYQRRYAEYVRVAKALQALTA